MRFLIEDLERFSEFSGRELNSHLPLTDAYRRILKVFEPISVNLIGQELNAQHLIQILITHSCTWAMSLIAVRALAY